MPHLPEMPRVAVVILNFNGKEFLEHYLPSVVEHLHEDAELIVVDNASTDGSAAWLIEHYPNLRLISMEKNFGYAGGYNRALQDIKAEYYLLLNSDVEVTEDWMQPMIDLMDAQPEIAALQPKIKSYEDIRKFEYAGASGGLLDKWGYPFCRGRIFDHVEMDLGQYDDPKRIFWATGAAFMIRADRFLQAGGFDDRFFAHMEEIDLCWRLQHMGHQIWVQPASEVYHLGGGTLQNGSALKYYLNYRNNLAMLTKNLSSSNWWLLILWKMILDGISALNFFIGGRPFVLWQVLKAHAHYWRNLSHWKKERKRLKRNLPDTELFQKSVVWNYFVKKKRSFQDLID